MVTVCPSQFATRRTLFHVLVGCGLLMLKVSRLKLPVIWLLVSMWLNTLTKSQIMPDRTEANPNELNQDDARYGFRCCHLKNIWTAPLPPETELSRQMTTSTTSIDIMGLQAAYANLHTDQERDYFMQRYHDVISSFGGKTSYDADNRPLLVMRSNLW